MRPIRIVLRWQLIATAVLTLVAAILWGRDGALSAALGGSINLASGWAYAWIVSRSKPQSAGDTIRTVLRAEAVKVFLIVVLLGLVLANYGSIVHGAFFASFVLTVAIFAAAIAVRDDENKDATRATGNQ